MPSGGALVSEAGLEPARLPIRPSNVRVCQFRHSDVRWEASLRGNCTLKRLATVVTPRGFEPLFAP